MQLITGLKSQGSIGYILVTFWACMSVEYQHLEKLKNVSLKFIPDFMST